MTEHRAAEAVQASGAPSHEDLSWHAIDWRAVHSNVRRLQARIVKATQPKCCETASFPGR
jgi:hypothetical protein